jgi:hypothetical protein
VWQDRSVSQQVNQEVRLRQFPASGKWLDSHFACYQSSRR